MAREPVIRGYLLEECLAWLLRGSGYRLLVSADEDPVELQTQGHQLRVRGRGTSHQVDVLGELAFTPAFSLPVRMFLEAKYYSTPCRLDVVRNAHGVIDDVNENYATRSSGDGPPLRRYHYAYALFSASGFTADAGQYALAQQISLVDLSLPAFAWLLEPIAQAAGKLYRRQQRFKLASFPVNWLRVRLRDLLGTVPAAELPQIETGAPLFAASAEQVLVALADALHAHQQTQLLLGFPAAPFVLALRAEDKAAFRSFAAKHPSHPVYIRRTGGEDGEWLASPMADEHAYQLAFTMPQQVEDWITANEVERATRTRQIKLDLLSAITIYDEDDAGEQLVYRLRYTPGSLRR